MFKIRGDEKQSSSFEKKANSIFSALSKLDHEHKTASIDDRDGSKKRPNEDLKEDDYPKYKKDKTTKQEISRNSSRLDLPPRRSFKHRRLDVQYDRKPLIKKDPKKWTEYSLASVSDADMSDRSNTMAALSFLKKNVQKETTETLSENRKATFKKPSALKASTSSDITLESNSHGKTVSFSGSKRVMKEYVVGEKSKKAPAMKQKTNIENSKNLKLSHLLDFDDEDE